MLPEEPVPVVSPLMPVDRLGSRTLRAGGGYTALCYSVIVGYSALYDTVCYGAVCSTVLVCGAVCSGAVCSGVDPWKCGKRFSIQTQSREARHVAT